MMEEDTFLHLSKRRLFILSSKIALEPASIEMHWQRYSVEEFYTYAGLRERNDISFFCSCFVLEAKPPVLNSEESDLGKEGEILIALYDWCRVRMWNVSRSRRNWNEIC
jgi:hypothetical protein